MHSDVKSGRFFVALLFATGDAKRELDFLLYLSPFEMRKIIFLLSAHLRIIVTILLTSNIRDFNSGELKGFKFNTERFLSNVEKRT